MLISAGLRCNICYVTRNTIDNIEFNILIKSRYDIERVSHYLVISKDYFRGNINLEVL